MTFIEDQVADQAEPLVKTFKEAIASLEDVQHYLESKGHLEVSFKVGSIVDTVAALLSNSITQTSLFEIFHTSVNLIYIIYYCFVDD